jgi:hypothetical protein
MGQFGSLQAELIDTHHHRAAGNCPSGSEHCHPATDLSSLGRLGDGRHVRLDRDVESVAERYDEEA